MARQPRKYSETGWYHIMVKGVGNQIIFEDDYDRLKFIELMVYFCKQLNVSVLAYCLMENHVHLLIKDQNCNVSLFMKKLEMTYAYYFNVKYRREGPLFNGRFRSEAIDDDVYLKTVFRYILRNPEKAGVCKYQEYKWNSYYEIYGKVRRKITDIEFLMAIFGGENEIIHFLNVPDETNICLEITKKVFYGLDDETAKKIIRKKLHIKSGVLIRAFDRIRRNHSIKILKAAGLSVRQLERLTGVSRGVVQQI